MVHYYTLDTFQQKEDVVHTISKKSLNDVVHTTSKKSLNAIGPDSLCIIFSFLNFSECHNITRVCGGWKRISEKYPYMSEFIYENNPHIDHLNVLLQHSQKIKKLIVRNITNLDLWIPPLINFSPNFVFFERCSEEEISSFIANRLKVKNEERWVMNELRNWRNGIVSRLLITV